LGSGVLAVVEFKVTLFVPFSNDEWLKFFPTIPCVLGFGFTLTSVGIIFKPSSYLFSPFIFSGFFQLPTFIKGEVFTFYDPELNGNNLFYLSFGVVVISNLRLSWETLIPN